MTFEVKTRAKVEVTQQKVTYIVGKVPNLKINQVKNLIFKILKEALEKAVKDQKLWVNDYVPKRTGQLREDLIKHLESSKVQGMTAELVMGVDETVVPYVKYVNKFNTRNVRHFGTYTEHSGRYAYAYYGGHRGRILLNDPKAIGHFWGLMRENGKARLKLRLKDSIKNNTGAIGVPAKPFSDQLKVT